MRYLFRFVYVLSVCVSPLVGCSDLEDMGSAGNGGIGGTAGEGGSSGTDGTDLCADSDCNDGNLCTRDQCLPENGACEHLPVAALAPCEFGSKGHTDITVTKVCDGSGNCVECIEDENCAQDCTVRRCNLTSNTCEGDEDAPLNTPCGFGFCDAAGTCVECNEDEQCDDFVDCTSDSCSSATSECNESTPVVDGTPCEGGECQDGQCALSGSVLPCTDQGIRNAIAAGGGPYTFDCDGPTTITTRARILIDNDVILDGEGNITLDGSDSGPPVVWVERATVALRGFAITGGDDSAGAAGSAGIVNFVGGALTVTNCVVSGNQASGAGAIINAGTMTVEGSTISQNIGSSTIANGGTMILVNSTLSGNESRSMIPGHQTLINGLVANLTLVNCTVSGPHDNESATISNSVGGTLTMTNTVVDGPCGTGSEVLSGGGNIESPGNTCGFDQGTDQVDVTDGQLNLGLLQDNGGPTETHALGEGSVAIDVIPADMCEVDEDQRSEPRPGGTMCDVGAFEVQEGDLLGSAPEGGVTSLR